MHLRRWLVMLAAAPAALAILWIFPLAAEAGIGVGVQAGPVLLPVIAHPGGSYALPPVYVVDTGTQAESVRLRIERLSGGSGLTIPPSWVRLPGAAVRLQPRQGTRIPLQLVLPAGVRAGPYLSDVVVAGTTPLSAGQANLGVAAATKLEFRVGRGLAQQPLPFLPVGTLWVTGGALLAAAGLVAFRRSGLRIRIERETGAGARLVTVTGAAGRRPGAAGESARRRVRAGAGRRNRAGARRGNRAGALVLTAAVLSALASCGTHTPAAPPAGQGANLRLSLKSVPTVRSISVSPTTAAFGNCSGGNPSLYTSSTTRALGYPNGRCSAVGPPAAGSYPITITNTGIAASIDVNGANAVPSDRGSEWGLCDRRATPAVTCSGRAGLPGPNQYLVQNLAPGRQNTAGLTATPACDHEFGPGGSCRAGHGQSQTEGIQLIGPTWSADSSTSWTVTITWTPYPQ